MITYEYPLNERIRTLLRLEDLFERSRHFIARTDPLDHHVALLTLFEILEVSSRADLKSGVINSRRFRSALSSAITAGVISAGIDRCTRASTTCRGSLRR